MIRSRLLFLALLLAYLGMTLIGLYTCACLIPPQAAQQANFDDYVEDVPLTNTAAATLPGLDPGEHEISVFLAVGTHEEYQDGDSVTVVVEEE